MMHNVCLHSALLSTDLIVSSVVITIKTILIPLVSANMIVHMGKQWKSITCLFGLGSVFLVLFKESFVEI